jgi:nitroreductase
MSETYKLLDVIERRWSPRSYNGKEIEPEKLRVLFDAAHWAASCFGEEPWRFVVAPRTDQAQFERLLGLLVPKNQDWAKHAGALAISFAKKTFSYDGTTPDRFGVHDTGTAFGQMSIQAVALGLHVHGMGGFDAARTRTEFAVPDDFEVCAAMAIGYLDGDGAPPAGRKRKPLTDLIFTGAWGAPASFVK